MKYKPFKDEIIDDHIIREFDNSKDDDEYIWHIDEYDRTVEVLETDNTWKFQFDNQLPFTLNGTIVIKKGCYHRLIKGNGKLKIKIKEIKDGNS